MSNIKNKQKIFTTALLMYAFSVPAGRPGSRNSKKV